MKKIFSSKAKRNLIILTIFIVIVIIVFSIFYKTSSNIEKERKQIKYDSNMISMYIDGEMVNSLDSTKKYNLVNYMCANEETVTWDSDTYSLSVTPLIKNSKCILYFEKEKLPTIYDKILTDNPTIKNDSTGLFANIADEISESGLFRTTDLTKTEDTDGDGVGEEVLYFRGVVENNYLVFAGFCWRIVRTNESGKSIKLRYGGEYDSANNTCPQTGTNVSIVVNGTNTFAFSYNGQNNNVKYVKWVNTGEFDSNAKTIVELWYTQNIETQGTNVTNLIIDEPFCNDTKVASTSGQNIYYAAYSRLNTNKSPQYKCSQESDKYSVSKGNINKPVALLTADEASYAGGRYYSSNGSSNNKTYYLYTGFKYWLMSACVWNGTLIDSFIVYPDGFFSDDGVDGPDGFLPVVSLDSNASVALEGTGEYNNPYVIVTN